VSATVSSHYTIMKKIDEYSPGDVIRGTFYSKKISKEKREHCFIVIDSKKEIAHKPCLPACSFSSKPPSDPNIICVDLSTYSIPSDFFKNAKKTSFLRIGEPRCLKAFEIKEHLGNLQDYDNLWENICELIEQKYKDNKYLVERICECDCLESQNISVSYCNEDDAICHLKNIVICSCCRSEISKSAESFINCPYCNDNLFIIILDDEGNISSEFYKNNE